MCFVDVLVCAISMMVVSHNQAVFISCAYLAVVSLTSFQRAVLVHGLVHTLHLTMFPVASLSNETRTALHVHNMKNGNPGSKSGANAHSSSNNVNHSASRKELQFGPFGSLQVLALVVSLFFSATVFFAGDLLFATPSKDASKVPILDADEVLQKDFARIDSSVPFRFIVISCFLVIYLGAYYV
jgi:hypothetical protein